MRHPHKPTIACHKSHTDKSSAYIAPLSPSRGCPRFSMHTVTHDITPRSHLGQGRVALFESRYFALLALVRALIRISTSKQHIGHVLEALSHYAADISMMEGSESIGYQNDVEKVDDGSYLPSSGMTCKIHSATNCYHHATPLSNGFMQIAQSSLGLPVRL